MHEFASYDCSLDVEPPWAGARHIVNSNYILWEQPCFLGPYQASSAFVVTQNPPQNWAEVLTFPNPPGLEGEQVYGAMNAEVDHANGLVRATQFGRGLRDCGSHAIYRLTDGPGEVLDFELLEYRDKPECDGLETDPVNWPLVYQAY
nr:DUF1176 domain-containing protein [Roseibium hamelinense]